jgi:hypothetical protein
MKDEDRFRELMTVLGEIHDRQITRLLLDVYWRILEPFPDEACIRTFHELIGRVKFFPKPAEFLELLEARQGDQATSAWLDVFAALKRYGNYQSVRFADPVIHSAIEAMGGWVSFGLMEEKDCPWRQKEFERLYAVLAGRCGGHPAYLAGLHEINNAAGGYPVQQVIDVAGPSGMKQLPRGDAKGFNDVVRLQGEQGRLEGEGGDDDLGDHGHHLHDEQGTAGCVL